MERNTKCFICREITSAEAVFSGVEEGLLFKFLCTFFNLPFNYQVLPGIPNSEFCNECKKMLMEAMNINKELVQLQMEAVKIRCHLRRCITCSYGNIIDKFSEPTASVGKYFVQCKLFHALLNIRHSDVNYKLKRMFCFFKVGASAR